MKGCDIIIKFDNVVKSYLINKNETNVLNNISFNIKKGEIFGIVGKTGAGKSTILRLISGFILADSGNIYILDQLLTKQSRKQLVKEMSVIFQNYNLLNNLTVLENVMLPLKIRGNKKDYNKAIELLSFVGLANFLNEYPKTLSGGQKQRVAIARSLITNPKILLCDEPTSALDNNMSIEIISLLKEINQKYKTTIVLITHQTEIIKMICDRALVLSEGKVEDIIKINSKEIKRSSYKELLEND